MNLATLIPLALKASIMLNVFCLGLAANPSDAISLFRSPGRLARSLVSMYVVMPLAAVALISAFDLLLPVKIALVTLAVAPVPPLFPRKAMKAGSERSHTIGLLVAATVAAVVVTPLAIELLGQLFHTPTQPLSAIIVRILLAIVIAPLVTGMLVRRLAPALAGRAAKPLMILATVLLIAGSLSVLFIAWPAIRSLIGNGTLAALAAFVLIGLFAGHILGGTEAEGRTMLALSTASRHPGIAMAIAHTDFPEQKFVGAAILLYLIVSAVMSMLYISWRER
jgi:BASS family bile acid:Na+ symporter